MFKCNPQHTSQWKKLQDHFQSISSKPLSQLFNQDPDRFSNFSTSTDQIFFDYSKNHLNHETIELLVSLAQEMELPAAIQAMFNGEAINNTENRPALHSALRAGSDSAQASIVSQTQKAIGAFVESVHNQSWKGYSDKAITDVVNIGIGGSDLGPSMVYQGLSPYHVKGLGCHFVSNVDPSHLTQLLATLNPETTLFIIASKTFTTLETLQNAEAAKTWFLNKAGDSALLAKHFVAASTNVEKAQEFGIDAANIFPLWDWVGGRYSLWSAIGLPIALGVGMSNFMALLKGAQAMDSHFRTADFKDNIPVLMGLLAIWYSNFFKAPSQTILPYEQNLHLLPAFLQQLDMESLGKSVNFKGEPVATGTGAIIWGSAGTNGQHSFHQLLHQGTHLIPADFIATKNNHYDNKQHQYLLPNVLPSSTPH